MNSQDEQTTRREALLRIAGSTTLGTAAFPILGQNPPPENRRDAQRAVTTREAAYEYEVFSPHQRETLDALGETIIPTDAHSPGAKAARVSEYIDALVSGAPPHVKLLWSDGLAAVERVTQQRFRRPYPQCSLEQQTEILAAIAGDEEPQRPLEEDFFHVLKRATIDGYYTSRIGIFQDLQYQGNEALPDFPGCDHNDAGGKRL